jgi:hypothetical protein
VASRRNRVHCFAGRAHEVLDELLGADGSAFVSLSDLSAAATRESIVELSRLQDRIAALRGRLLDHGEAIGVAAPREEDDGPEEDPYAPVVPGGSTAAWYAEAVRTPVREAEREVGLARRLEDAFHATGRALAAGLIGADQAQVIVTAVDALPDIVLETERRAAEEHLLAEARRFDARVLARLARHLLEVIDPEGLEEYLAAQLEAEEARAARSTYFSMREDGRGTVHGRFAIPALNAAMLQTALDAIANPRRPEPLDRERSDETGTTVPVPSPELLGQAFCELLERYPADKLPGGINATVVVTMQLESLTGGLDAATLDTGTLISAAEARRLAAQCGVIPAVLDSEGVLLDLGRTVRLHTGVQRIALRARHRTCTVEGCFVPSAWCHAHHKRPWSQGGETSIRNGTLLCPAHHRLAHRPGAVVTYEGETTRISQTSRRRH